MRYSKNQKSATQAMIVNSASAAFRKKGVNAVSIVDLMRAIGLTHGGFYLHFKSREDLVGATVTSAMGQTNDHFRALIDGAPPGGGLAAIVDVYLSARHRDISETGCPLPAMAADIARASAATRSRFTRELASMIDLFAEQFEEESDDAARDQATAAIAALVGSLILARATNSRQLSDHILAAGRRAALSSAPAATKRNVRTSNAANRAVRSHRDR